MGCYRVTKYDPSKRDARGWYTVEEWTSISDIGKSIGGATLTVDAYARVEDAYVFAVLRFFVDAGQPDLRSVGVAIKRPETVLSEGQRLDVNDLEWVTRACLREQLWCRIETADRSFGVHFGYDYYMYICTPAAREEVLDDVRAQGLFVESISASPHEPEPDSERESH
jgi:hypothetical protein